MISLTRSEINLTECMETSPSDGPGHTPLYWHTESHTGLDSGLPFLGRQIVEGHRFPGSLALRPHQGLQRMVFTVSPIPFQNKV